MTSRLIIHKDSCVLYNFEFVYILVILKVCKNIALKILAFTFLGLFYVEYLIVLYNCSFRRYCRV